MASDATARPAAERDAAGGGSGSMRALAAADPGLAGLLLSQRFRGIRLQFAMRYALIAFIGATLVLVPPSGRGTACFVILAGYVGWCVAAAVWNDRGGRAPLRLQWVALVVDAVALAAVALVAGTTPGDTRTADPLGYGFFVIPVVAAAQVRPVTCAIVCVATVAACFASSTVNHGSSHALWSWAALRTVMVACVSFGCVSLAFIQRWRLLTIGALAAERSELLRDLLGVEARERAALSDTLHDGALQYVLAAGQEIEQLRPPRDGALDQSQAVERVAEALRRARELLRSALTELHPAVLSTAGLPASLRALAATSARAGTTTVHVDTEGWPEEEGARLEPEVEALLYAAARELLANIGKHAAASEARVLLRVEADDGSAVGAAVLVVSDDGVGMDLGEAADKVAMGHVGLASLRIRLAAAGGSLVVLPDAEAGHGTVATVRLPCRAAGPG